MYHDNHPTKHYEMANKVVVFDRPHAILGAHPARIGEIGQEVTEAGDFRIDLATLQRKRIHKFRHFTTSST